MQRLKVYRSRFFWKLYLTSASLFLILVTTIGSLLYLEFKNSLQTSLRTSLQDKLTLISWRGERLFSPDNEKAGATIRFLGKETNTRITLIGPDGRVIADSDLPTAELSNHRDRSEFQTALRQKFGYAERHSTSKNEPMIYMAQAVRDDDQLLGVIRVAIPTANVREDLFLIRSEIALTSLAGVFIALIVGLFLVRSMTIPIAEMMHVCESMRQGRYDEKVTTLTRDELGLLGDTLNRLGDEITDQIARISLDRAQLKTIMANMVEGIIAVNERNEIQFCNRAAYELLGSNLGDCRGMRLDSTLGFDKIADTVAEARSHNKPVERELEMKDELDRRYLEIYASPYKGAESQGAIAVLHDISDIRKLESVRRDFVANVSHELKTPLTAIKGYTETLLAGALDDRDNAQRFIAKVDANADRLVALVKDILSLAQVEAAEQTLLLRTTLWDGVIDDVLSRYEGEFKKKHLVVSVEKGAEPLPVLGEQEAMLKVFDNLISNAIRYTPDNGQIKVTLRQKYQQVCLEVADTGIGILPKHQSRIFQRFYRVDKARSREVGGTGLGLAIVKHLVSAMKGRVTVESEINRGSLFKVYLQGAGV